MPDALSQALANAAANTPKGEELHLENLDSIADPTLDQPVIDYHQKMQQEYDARKASQRFYVEGQSPQKEADYYAADKSDNLTLDSIDYKLGEIINAFMHVHKDSELTKLRLDALADMISEVSTTISKAAQSMPQEPDLKHRSLHEWDDTYLINELVERENALMPFYYELLKRIGSPDLHNLVMSSMQGKNSSMIVLAQLCAALGNAATQPQPQSKPVDHTLADAYKQLEDSLPFYDKFSRQHREEAAGLVDKYKLTIEKRDALSDSDFKAYQSFMNELLHRATFMERIPNRESQPIAETEHQRLEQMSPLERQQFAQRMNQSTPFNQAVSEYVRDNTPPSHFAPYQTIPPQNRA